MHRAYGILHVKAVDADKRIITGLATTPEPDRVGDIIEPLGVSFKNPLPLLLHHDAHKPVGWTKFKKPTKDGVEFEASLPTIDEPGALRDRVEEAWQSVKSGLISGVSIGFRAIEEAFNKETNGFRYLKTEVVELSLVTIPANASATIHSIKSLDQAASGLHSPGVSGLPVVHAVKAAKPMTIQEQITQFENTRAAKAARMNELMTKAANEGVTLDASQTEEYDGLAAEVQSVDAHLVRMRDLEKTNLVKATPITATTPQQAAEQRGGSTPVITVKSMLPKGTAFTRMAMAIAACHGSKYEAAEYAKRWDNTSPEVSLYLKAAIAAGTTVDATFAAPLAVANPLAGEFIELLRPKTLLGRIPNLRRVPFNVSVPAQTAGGTYGWVGQGKVKPLTNIATATVTLVVNKIAGIIVLTEELVKLSTPSAEDLVRNEMIAGIVKFMDEQFIDPAVAVSGTVSPASITNGTTPITSAGTSSDNARTDIKAVMAAFVAANLSTENAVWIMSEANAFALATAVTALGQPAFPGMLVNGGFLFGIPVIATQSAGTTVALVDAQGILVADDGGVTIDVSREASLQMDSAPTDPPDAAAVYVSMFQNNLVALRAERFVTWKRARTASVKYVAQSYV